MGLARRWDVRKFKNGEERRYWEACSLAALNVSNSAQDAANKADAMVKLREERLEEHDAPP